MKEPQNKKMRFPSFSKLRMRSRLFILFFTLLTLTMLLVSFGYYKTTVSQLVKQYGEESLQKIVQTNTIINLRMSKVVENSELLITDKELIEIFLKVDPEQAYDLMKSDREIKRILAKYYTPNEWIYSYSILTDYYNFGEGYIPYRKFQNTELFQKIADGRGQLVWHPTYDFVQMYSEYDIENCDIDNFRYLFSCGRLINSVDNSSSFSKFVSHENTYMLLVNFREQFLVDSYSTLLTDDNAVYIISSDKKLVSSSNDSAHPDSFAWVDTALENNSGILYTVHDGNQIVVCYDTSELTGWTLVTVMGFDVLAKEAGQAMRVTILQLIVLFICIALILAIIMSTATTRPINKLIQAISHMEQGDFTKKVSSQGHLEFDELIGRFNEMNDKIQSLIHENYEVKLNEKDAQIKLLNIQLNPHFLYNTFNLVNCIAIENRCSEITKIVTFLSKMLRYTVEIKQATGNLREEIEWLDGYIYIMSCRYEQEIDYHCEIEDDMMEDEVPRLFLQPFVENSFVHGFDGLDRPCKLTIFGWRQNGRRYFAIEDDGLGFEQDRVNELFEGKRSVGIQNVHRRLQLMYGPEYGVRIVTQPLNGTKVILQFP